MEQASSEQASSAFSTGVPALAAIPQLAGNSRQGFGVVASTSRWGSGFSISSNTLGLSTSLYDGDAGSRSTGKERDAESGNDYFEARYYSGAMGRFLSPDFSEDPEPILSRIRKLGQWDKWKSCSPTAIKMAEMRSNDDATFTPEPHIGL